MKRTHIARSLLLLGHLSIGAAFFSACHSDDDAPSYDQEDAPNAAQTRLFDGRLGKRLSTLQTSELSTDSAAIGSSARVFDLGPAQFADPKGPSVVQPQMRGEVPSAAAPSGIVMGHEGREYLVELDVSEHDSDAVQADILADRLALAATLEAGEAEAQPSAEKNVIGNEGRIRQGISDGVASNSWMAAVGLLSSNTSFTTQVCTGTLIRPDVVLTAAHCVVVWAQNATKVNQLAFHPRADKTTTTTYPWGNWLWRSSYFYPTAYVNNNCHKTYTGACQESDWALVRVTKPSSASMHNFYMTLASRTQAQMNDLKNRGYPICTAPGAPTPSCLAQTLYGDNGVCALTTTFGNDGGFSTRVAHSCDANHGHSGGPLYQYVNGVPTLVGVHLSDAGVVAPIDGNNWMRHVTPAMITLINNTIPNL